MKPRKIVPIGPLGKGSADAPHYIPERQEFDIPDRITNSASKEPFTGITWFVREGGSDHLKFKSRGV